LNPFRSICSTIWNLLTGEKEVSGVLVALILVGRFKLSTDVWKSIITLSSSLRVGKGNDGVSPSWNPKLCYHDNGIIIYSPVFYLYSFFIYSIVLVCYSIFFCIFLSYYYHQIYKYLSNDMNDNLDIYSVHEDHLIDML
jgi:hypothetical protein